MSMLRSAVLLAILAGFLALAAAVRAEGPCRVDAEKLCADSKAEKGAIQACLEFKAAELSEACKTKLAEVKSRRGPFVAPCAYDVTLLCSDANPGEGRVAACLAGKQDQLTPKCKEMVVALSAK